MENQGSWIDDYMNLPMPEYHNNHELSTWNVGEATSSSSETVFQLGHDGLGARNHSQIPADDEEMLLPANSASSSRMLSQHILVSLQSLGDAGRKDGLRPDFFNTDEGYTTCGDHLFPGSKRHSSYDNIANSVPPLIHWSNPATVVGDLSLRRKRIEEYNPASGLWEVSRTEVSPFSVNGSTYQNYVYYKDSENREFRCCIDHAQGAPRVVMFDIKKQNWVQGCIHRPIPLVKTSDPTVSRLHVTTHILGCGGFIFVYSEQEVGEDVFSCVHKFSPDCFGEGMWEEIWVELRSSTGPDDVRVYPDFTDVQVLSASLLQCGGSAFVFSEQASRDSEVILIVQRRKRVWEPVLRRKYKRKRHRSPNWTPEEITAFLEAKVEALDAVQVGKPDWDFISERLEQRGFNRGPQACEDQWGTQLKRLDKIKNYVQAHNITTGTSCSGWDGLWNMSESERTANDLPRVFTFLWYKMMEKIHEKKPWKSKSTGAGLKQKSAASTVTSSNSSGFSFPLRAQIPTSSQLADEDQSRIDVTAEVSSLCDYLLEGRQNLTNNQIASKKDEALEIVKSSLALQLERLRAQNRQQATTRRRPRKSRKTHFG